MSLADWSNKTNPLGFVLVVDPVYEGSKSLKVDNSIADPAIKVLDQSETDSPADVTVVTRLYMTPLSGGGQYSPAIFFRYQDTSNYFSCDLLPRTFGNNDVRIHFCKKVAGALTRKDLGLISGAGFYSVWHKAEFIFCQLGTNVYLEVLIDDVSQGAAEWGSLWGGGGGIGLGNYDGHATARDHYFDLTEIYY